MLSCPNLEKENENLKYGVYNSGVRDSIQDLFGTWDIMKMRALKGTGKVGLEEHINQKESEENEKKSKSMHLLKASMTRFLPIALISRIL